MAERAEDEDLDPVQGFEDLVSELPDVRNICEISEAKTCDFHQRLKIGEVIDAHSFNYNAAGIVLQYLKIELRRKALPFSDRIEHVVVAQFYLVESLLRKETRELFLFQKIISPQVIDPANMVR